MTDWKTSEAYAQPRDYVDEIEAIRRETWHDPDLGEDYDAFVDDALRVMVKVAGVAIIAGIIIAGVIYAYD